MSTDPTMTRGNGPHPKHTAGGGDEESFIEYGPEDRDYCIHLDSDLRWCLQGTSAQKAWDIIRAMLEVAHESGFRDGLQMASRITDPANAFRHFGINPWRG
jgi:hypothetical protein